MRRPLGFSRPTKTLDLGYNPKFSELTPAFKEAASRFAQEQSQPLAPNPSPNATQFVPNPRSS